MLFMNLWTNVYRLKKFPCVLTIGLGTTQKLENIHVIETDFNIQQSGRLADWNTYTHSSNKVNNLKKAAKQFYFSNLEDTVNNARSENPKKYWKNVHTYILVTWNSKSESIPILRYFDNNEEKLFFSDKDKAECLNEYFASISTVDESCTTLPSFTKKCNNTLYEIVIPIDDVVNIITSLEVNKAVGPDMISLKLFKKYKTYYFQTTLCYF